TALYTLSLHDALPIFVLRRIRPAALHGSRELVERIEVQEELARLHARRLVDADAGLAVVVLVRVHVALAAAARGVDDERRRVEEIGRASCRERVEVRV